MRFESTLGVCLQTFRVSILPIMIVACQKVSICEIEIEKLDMWQWHFFFLFEKQSFTQFDSLLEVVGQQMSIKNVIIIVYDGWIDSALSPVLDHCVKLILSLLHLSHSPEIVRNSNINPMYTFLEYKRSVQAASTFRLFPVAKFRTAH